MEGKQNNAAKLFISVVALVYNHPVCYALQISEHWWLKHHIILEMQLSLNELMQTFFPRAGDNPITLEDSQDCFCT